MPRGYPKHRTGAMSEQTQKLMAALQEIEDRLAAERRKDRARAMLVSFAEKHDLSSADLREAARLVGAREKGDAPAISQNFAKAKARQLGVQIREARIAKGLAALQLVKLIGAKGTGAVSAWESGMVPTKAKYREGLIKHLGLPKNFFAGAPPPNKRGGVPGHLRKGKANGAAHPS